MVCLSTMLNKKEPSSKIMIKLDETFYGFGYFLLRNIENIHNSKLLSVYYVNRMNLISLLYEYNLNFSRSLSFKAT